MYALVYVEAVPAHWSCVYACGYTILSMGVYLRVYECLYGYGVCECRFRSVYMYMDECICVHSYIWEMNIWTQLWIQTSWQHTQTATRLQQNFITKKHDMDDTYCTKDNHGFNFRGTSIFPSSTFDMKGTRLVGRKKSWLNWSHVNDGKRVLERYNLPIKWPAHWIPTSQIVTLALTREITLVRKVVDFSDLMINLIS